MNARNLFQGPQSQYITGEDALGSPYRGPSVAVCVWNPFPKIMNSPQQVEIL